MFAALIALVSALAEMQSEIRRIRATT